MGFVTSFTDSVRIDNWALVLSTDDLTKRIGHKNVSAKVIRTEMNLYFIENELDFKVDGNLLGQCISQFKTRLFNDFKLKVPLF